MMDCHKISNEHRDAPFSRDDLRIPFAHYIKKIKLSVKY